MSNRRGDPKHKRFPRKGRKPRRWTDPPNIVFGRGAPPTKPPPRVCHGCGAVIGSGYCTPTHCDLEGYLP